MTASKTTIVFIQNSANLAGDQKCLFRLLSASALNADFSLKLLVGKRGWLTKACDETGIDYHLLPFPLSRSLGGRLYGSRRLARQATAHIKTSGSSLVIIHSNDHPDSLLGLWLARSLECGSMLTMRTPGMGRRDFLKYRCADHDALISVGETLFENVEGLKHC